MDWGSFEKLRSIVESRHFQHLISEGEHSLQPIQYPGNVQDYRILMYRISLL